MMIKEDLISDIKDMIIDSGSMAIVGGEGDSIIVREYDTNKDFEIRIRSLH